MHRLLVLALVACGGPQLQDKPVVGLEKLVPATLEAAHARTIKGDAKAAHLRVYVDATVREQPHWKEQITDEIDYASQYLTPLLGSRLVVDKWVDWDRQGDPAAALQALQALDPGVDTTWVLGYTTAGDTASRAFSELGASQTNGHHVVVRAWAERAEETQLAMGLPDLKDAQKQELFAAHRRHKQTVVLLHELAATLGAISEADATWLQNAAYSPKQHTFSDRNTQLMTLALDARLGNADDQAIAKSLLEVIDKTEWGGWIASDREAVIQSLRAIVDQGKAQRTSTDIPGVAYDQWTRIVELAKKDPRAALAELDNVLAAYPANATMHQLKCELLLALKDKAADKACARVIELAPGDPNPHIAIAIAALANKDVAGARAALVLAEDKIANLKDGAPAAWKKVLALYVQLGSLTWLEDAAQKAKLDGDPTLASVAQTRARYGVQRGAKYVKPEGEADLVAAVRTALSLVYANKFGEADRAIAAGEKKWPGAPGFEGVRCDLLMRQSQFGPAKAACARALATDPHESWALYLTGVLDLREPGTSAAGKEKLKAAIAADPELAQAWRTLAKAYARDKDKAALDELGKAYTAKFNQVLPP